jgi:hypothetical protein
LESNVQENRVVYNSHEKGRRGTAGGSISMNEKNGNNWNTMVMNNNDGQFEHKLHKR